MARTVPDDAVTQRLANGGTATSLVLDEGTASDGPWTLAVTEQNCLERKRRYSEEVACSLVDPGRLQDASSFRTEDDGEPVLVVNGPLQDGTSKVTINLDDRPPVQATPVLVSGRLFFSVRVPVDARINGIVAVDTSGEVVARLGKFPPPSS